MKLCSGFLCCRCLCCCCFFVQNVAEIYEIYRSNLVQVKWGDCCIGSKRARSMNCHRHRRYIVRVVMTSTLTHTYTTDLIKSGQSLETNHECVCLSAREQLAFSLTKRVGSNSMNCEGEEERLVFNAWQVFSFFHFLITDWFRLVNAFRHCSLGINRR